MVMHTQMSDDFLESTLGMVKFIQKRSKATAEHPANGPEYRAKFKALKALVRHLEFFVTPRCSAAAQEVWEDLGHHDFLCTAMSKWKGPSSSPAGNRLKFEHAKPVDEMTKEIIALSNPTIADLRRILEQAEIVWVTAEEDKKLTALGASTKRPGGWQSWYKKAGIQEYRKDGTIADF
jgi:hypothetical protein